MARLFAILFIGLLSVPVFAEQVQIEGMGGAAKPTIQSQMPQAPTSQAPPPAPGAGSVQVAPQGTPNFQAAPQGAPNFAASPDSMNQQNSIDPSQSPSSPPTGMPPSPLQGGTSGMNGDIGTMPINNNQAQTKSY